MHAQRQEIGCTCIGSLLPPQLHFLPTFLCIILVRPYLNRTVLIPLYAGMGVTEALQLARLCISPCPHLSALKITQFYTNSFKK